MKHRPHHPITRRTFMSGLAAGAIGASSFSALTLLGCRYARDGQLSANGFGPLSPVGDETTGLPLVQLPQGFRYLSYGWTGDPMSDDRPTPPAHDGMAVIGTRDGRWVLCRNHERSGAGGTIDDAARSYDPLAPGGCTLIEFDPQQERFAGARAALSGTLRNCAGGRTPWGTWLSCEETLNDPGFPADGSAGEIQRDHGWVFEVGMDGAPDPQPIRAMGRFVHEAVAVDAETGIVYQTEDRSAAGFYRYLPAENANLAAGGRLEMLRVPGHSDLRTGATLTREYPCEWVAIEHVERAHSPDTVDEHGVYMQGLAQGATTFARLEGCWYHDGRIYFDATSGGEAGVGQIWCYEPRQECLRLIFESPGRELIDHPDNLCPAPGGGLLLCEDGLSDPKRIMGLTEGGKLFTFAYNNVVLAGERNSIAGDFRAQEWAGCCFSPDGEWMFANIQRPGITLAITGPWLDLTG